MIASAEDIQTFKTAFYGNTADDTADPVAIALEAVDRQRGERDRTRQLATAAAAQATEATAELLRFAREGDGIEGTFETDVIEQLLDAAKMAIECLPEGDVAMKYSDIYADLTHELEFWA